MMMVQKKKKPVARKERKGNGKPKAFASFPFHEDEGYCLLRLWFLPRHLLSLSLHPEEKETGKPMSSETAFFFERLAAKLLASWSWSWKYGHIQSKILCRVVLLCYSFGSNSHV
jgi:hypothetical protein